MQERRLVRFLDSVKEKASAIYLLGDMFDFWDEYRYVVPKGYTRFLGKLSELTDMGVEVHNLQNLCEMSHREGTHIVLSGVTPNVYNVLEHNGFCQLLGKDHICPNINVALDRAASIVKRG